ncbi:hypothetical protein ACS0TY_019096 [Phlomoides rotata]
MAMGTYLSVILLLLTIITAATLPVQPPPLPLPSPAATPLPPPPPPLSTTHTPPSPPEDIQENQLKNIIDALIGAGDFGGWAHLLSSADSSAFPLRATLFIPSDDAAAHSASVTDAGISFDPFLIPYHVIPRRLTFSDLRGLAVDTRIPTLLPSKFIIVTNNSASNFTVDSSQITQADIFSNAAFAVHGINNVLDYSVYGVDGGVLISPPPEEKADPEMPESTAGPRKRRNPAFPEEIFFGVRSDAPNLRGGFWVLIALMILIHVFLSDCGVRIH